MSTNPPPGGYPQPVSDAAAARGCTPQPPQKRRSVLKIVLITAGALVLVVGGLIAWAAIDAVKTVGAKTVEAKTVGAKTVEAKTVEANKLVPPAGFQTFTRQDDSPMMPSEQTAAQSFVSILHLAPTVAIYGASGSQTPSFLFFGGYGDMLGAQFGVSDFWTAMGSHQGTSVSGRQNEPTGPHGGSMQCAHVHLNPAGKTLPVCVWADNSDFGAIMDYSRIGSSDVSGTAAMTLAFRQVAEVKK